jgi:Domain of unknown function (DUF4845)
MMIPSKNQQGYTLISLIFILGIFGFFVMLVLKIGPIYLDHSKVKSALAAVKESTDIQQKSEEEIRTMLSKRFGMNYVSHVQAEDKHAIKIRKIGNYLKVETDYEVVEKIAGNLSVLVVFNDVIEIGKE